MRSPEVGLAELDPRIVRLSRTTFCGRRLTRRQIADIRQTADSFPPLRRTELGYTVCEHLGWHTARGATPPATGAAPAGGTRAARDPS